MDDGWTTLNKKEETELMATFIVPTVNHDLSPSGGFLVSHHVFWCPWKGTSPGLLLAHYFTEILLTPMLDDGSVLPFPMHEHHMHSFMKLGR